MSSFDDDDDRPKAKIAVKKVSTGPAAAPAAVAEAAAAQAAVAAALSPDHAALARRLFLYPKQEKRKVAGVEPAQVHLRLRAFNCTCL